MRPAKSDTVFVGIGSVVSGLGGFGFTWAVARGAGVAGAGAVLTLTTWFVLLAGITKLGMDTTLVREGGRIRAGKAEHGARALVPWTLVPALVLSAVLAVAVAVTSSGLSHVILPSSPVELAPLVVIGAVALPAAVGTIVALALLRGLGSIRPFVLIEQIGKPGARTLAALALVAFGLSASAGYFAAWILPVWLGALVTWLALHRRLRHESRERLPVADRRRIFRYSSARAASQIVDLVNSSLGLLLLGALADAAAAGQYATAFRIILAGQLVFQAARLLLAPSLAALLAARRLDDADETFSSATTVIVLGAWPLFLACLVFPGELLSIFGPGFADGALTLQVLAMSGLLLALVGNQGSVVLMAGRSQYALLATAAALVVNVAVTLALIKTIGPVGAAAGWTAATLVEGLLLGLRMRSLGVTPLPRAALRAAALTCATVGSGLLIFRLAGPSQSILAWLALSLGVVFWLLICIPLGRRAFALLTQQKPGGEQPPSPREG